MPFSPIRTGDDKIDRNLDSIASNFNPLLKTTAATAWTNIGDPGAPSFGTGYANYQAYTWAPASFRKDANGMVWLRGLIKNTTAGALSTTLFTIPKGWRPDLTHIFPGESGDAFWQFEVRADGSVVPRASIGAGAHASLFGCWLAVS